MSDFRIVFIHGYTASSRENWYPNISIELAKLGVDFVVPDLPGGDHPHAAEWLEVLHTEIGKSNKPLVLVGHSLGTRTILLYLEKYSPKLKAAVMIATFANRLENAYKYDGDGYPDFFVRKVDVADIKSLVEKWVVVHSRDDELDYEQAEEIAQELGAKLITFGDRGHMSGPENAPVILDILRKELNF